MPDSFLLELAHAQLVRELFPDAPLKYMPPTKHMTGNVFAGYLLDAFFNLCGVMTDQSILLIGMMTEGIHHPVPVRPRPGPGERPVRAARRRAAGRGRSGPSRTGSSPGGPGRCSARPSTCCGTIGSQGLLTAIAEGTFGVTKRPPDGGRGLDGVVERARGLLQPGVPSCWR